MNRVPDVLQGVGIAGCAVGIWLMFSWPLLLVVVSSFVFLVGIGLEHRGASPDR